MPFDTTPNETPLLRRMRLADALRNLPEPFKWDFTQVLAESSCGTSGCAIGLSSQIWPQELRFKILPTFHGICMKVDEKEIAEFFGMTFEEVDNIFFNRPYYKPFYKVEDNDVTPTMVADALEALPFK